MKIPGQISAEINTLYSLYGYFHPGIRRGELEIRIVADKGNFVILGKTFAQLESHRNTANACAQNNDMRHVAPSSPLRPGTDRSPDRVSHGIKIGFRLSCRIDP